MNFFRTYFRYFFRRKLPTGFASTKLSLKKILFANAIQFKSGVRKHCADIHYLFTFIEKNMGTHVSAGDEFYLVSETKIILCF